MSGVCSHGIPHPSYSWSTDADLSVARYHAVPVKDSRDCPSCLLGRVYALRQALESALSSVPATKAMTKEETTAFEAAMGALHNDMQRWGP